MVFGLAQEAPGGDGESSEEQVRRTITMVTFFITRAFVIIQYKFTHILPLSLDVYIDVVSKWFYR